MHMVICFEILTHDAFFVSVKFMVDLTEKIISREQPEIIEDLHFVVRLLKHAGLSFQTTDTLKSPQIFRHFISQISITEYKIQSEQQLPQAYLSAHEGNLLPIFGVWIHTTCSAVEWYRRY